MKNSKAILQVPGTMKIISAEIPVPKEDEVLIKVEYVGICGSDVHGFESGPFIPPKDPNQEIGLGHECAGTVVAVGSRVRKFKPGDRVNIEPGVPCGHHGMNSLMRDASAFDFEENIRLTKEAVDFFHPLGIPVEAELGHVGNETVYEEALAGYHYTDPDQAAEFVERTGCDSLAVAIGNQHGVYTSEPQLNFEVVKRVRDAVSVPLVLHGASGISDADIKTAISLGIAKINIHTELCQAAMVAVKENQDQPFLHLEREVRKAVKERALEKIKLFGSDGKAE